MDEGGQVFCVFGDVLVVIGFVFVQCLVLVCFDWVDKDQVCYVEDGIGVFYDVIGCSIVINCIGQGQVLGVENVYVQLQVG